MGHDYKHAVRPNAFMRVDGTMWDQSFAVMNLDLTLSLVAVRLEHPYREYLVGQRRGKRGGVLLTLCA
jgi:hypothetical protein